MQFRLALIIGLLCCCAGLLPGAAAAADYPPGLMYSTLLNGVQLLSNNGQFRLDNIQAVFLPDPNNGEYRPYNPDGGAAAWTILSTAGGEELFRFDWYGELLKKPYWLLSSYKATDLRSGADAGPGWITLPGAGDYVLDFYLDSGRFYTFPFSVSTIASTDPFAGDDLWFIDGAWEDWGYFYYRDANPEMALQFKVWLRNKAHADNRDVKPRLEVSRGGELVCTGRGNMTYSLDPKWNRYEMDLIFPMEETSGGAYFKAKNLLETDGSYSLKLYLSDELYGEWKFTISGNQFVYAGRTVRGTAEPLTFIEGGSDAWWYERVK